MDREQARQEIRARIRCEDYLEKSKSGLYCCPFCGSGKGNKGTGALKLYKTNTWTCHACNKSGDVIDLYMNERGVDYNAALSLLAQEINITIDAYRPGGQSMEWDDIIEEPADTPQEAVNAPETPAGDQGGNNPPAADKTPNKGNTGAGKRTVFSVEEGHKWYEEYQKEMQERAAQIDYTDYYKACRANLKEPAAVEYLQGRGISPETAAAYWIGYDPAADPASAPGALYIRGGDKMHPCPRIIIPTSKTHYVGRRIDGKSDFAKINAKGSSPAIFNLKALYAQDVQEVFVTEGAFDALSIIEAGYTAIALNSASNTDTLLTALKKRRTGATLILCPDNDPDEKTAARVKKEFEELAAGLQRLNIPHIRADINAGCKDANEALTGNKEAFVDALEEAQRQTAAKPDNTKYYIDTLMSGEIERFKHDKKTGFANLDMKAGGLYAGLYVLAAISSLGKTSFALQLADQLAESGEDVIFFSMEQSRLELVSKSIARRTVKKDAAGKLKFAAAVSSLSIRKGRLSDTVLAAAAGYKEAVADRISVVEGNFNCTISFIGNYVRQYIRKTGSRPVIFIDYLQILQPAGDEKRQNTKEIVDHAVTELKRLSRELELTIIVISSVNRANYLTPISFESLKESGGIEFSCDVLWGLQLQCVKDSKFEKADATKQREIVNKAKAATPRKIELSCLKNRYGIANYSCYFNYYPANDLFEICSDTELDFDEPAETTPKAGRKLPKKS